MNEDLELKRDRMRFTKNSTSANLAILAIVFDVLYFVSIYQSDVGTWYYSILVGASIIYNLVFLLATFLSSEGVKNYKVNYSYLLAALGVMQIVRIFVIPLRARNAVVSSGGVEQEVMGAGQFTRLVIYLVCSAACLIASAVINYIKCRALEEHMKSLAGKSA